jgi:hypothetical protein
VGADLDVHEFVQERAEQVDGREELAAAGRAEAQADLLAAADVQAEEVGLRRPRRLTERADVPASPRHERRDVGGEAAQQRLGRIGVGERALDAEAAEGHGDIVWRPHWSAPQRG